MKRLLLFSMAVCLSALAINAQTIFPLKEIKQAKNKEVSSKVSAYKIFEFDSKSFNEFKEKSGTEFSFSLGFENEKLRSFSLQTNDIRSEDYVLQTQENGVQKFLPKNSIATFQGELHGEQYGSARLTIDENFIAGFWAEDGSEYYIEPLWRLDPSVPHNQYILYELKSVIFPTDFCHLETSTIAEKKKTAEFSTPEKTGDCLEVDIALAADFEMVQAFGSVASVESFILGVLANVQTNYDNEFDNELRFIVVTTFIASSNANDPWTNNTNAGTFLDDFLAWGNAGGFGSVAYDVASIWTDRNFNGTTIGVAYLNGICTSIRYGAMQNFSSNSALLRVVWAHELGHNFNSGHDSSGGFIMSPSVNNTTTWSTGSQNAINNYVASRPCLSSCSIGGGDPPIADFSFDPEIGCAPLEVDFYDESTGGSPDFWEWTMPGGDPDIANTQNTTTTYLNPGVYDASLYVENAIGSDSYSQSSIITVLTLPTADFDVVIDGFVADFFNNSTDADEYEWEFGDGGFSTAAEPIYTYTEAGEYTITLTAINECGSVIFTRNVIIESNLTASFFAPVVEGCAPLEVTFFDESEGNPTSWEWEFPGGDPSTSSDQNPVVNYNTAGSFDVSLTIMDDSGETDMISYMGLVNIGESPTADFTASIAPGEQSLTIVNNSTNADIYNWTFGDGATSMDETPSHTYDAPGDYVITLTVSNECGSDMISHIVTVLGVVDATFTLSSTTGCLPHTIQFEANPQAEDLTYTWSFPGGDPATSTDPNPSVTYNTAGSFDVSLTITNAAGESTFFQENIVTINNAPTAEFIFSNTIGSETVTFSNQSTNGDTFEWNFGDDQTSVLENPTHNYSEEGTYPVTLTATNECGSDTYTLDVEIVFLPTPSIGVSSNTGCAPFTTTYSASPTGSQYTYDWTFPGGNPSSSSEANPMVTYNQAGSYGATLVVTNAAGSSTLTEQDLIVVNDVPNADFTSQNTVGNGSVAFTNGSVNADTWEWNFGDDQMSSLENPSHTYTEEGTYSVTLTATNECGSDTHIQDINIIFLPNVAIAVSSNSGCAPMVVTYMASPTGSQYTYDWTFPGGDPASSSEANPMVTYNAAGNYGATLVVTNAAGSSTVTEQSLIAVNDIPITGFSGQNAVGNGTVSFVNESLNSDTWLWEFGDSQMSTLENPSHTYTEEGTYSVTLTATNECGSSTHTEDIEVIFLPEPAITVSSSSGCIPMMVTYMASPTGSEYTYDWSFPGGNPATSSEPNPTITYTQTGSYGATLVVTNAAGSTTITEENLVVVNTVPVANFTSDNTPGNDIVTFTNQSTNATNWLWNFGDEQTSNQENPSHTYTEEGTYTVTLAATNECGSDVQTSVIEIILLAEPSISVSSNVGCAPFSVTYIASPIGDQYTYSWSFPGGDPISSVDPNPIVTYTDAGSYSATLMVTNAAGSVMTNQEDIVVVNDGPVAEFIHDNQIGSGTVSFTNQSTNGDSWLWDFGNNETSILQNPTHTFTTEGVHPVTLTTTNECGSDTYTLDVTIVFPPEASITASSTQGCIPMVVNYQASPVEGGNTYTWVFPGGDPAFSSDPNPVVTYNTAGNFETSLTVSNSAGANTTTQTISVFEGPTAQFDFTVNGLTVNFENNSINADTYSWSIDGNVVNETNPSFVFPTTGTYEVVLTASNDCGSDTFSSTVSIEGQIPDLNFTVQNNEGCAPLVATFTSEIIGADEFMWSFEGGTPSTSMEANPTITYNEPGVYTATLSASNVYGSNALSQMDIIVVFEPTAANFDFTIDGATVDFQNTSTAANQIEWTFPDQTTSNEDNTSFTFPGNGSYEVTLNADGNCNSDAITQTIIIDGEISNSSFSMSAEQGCAPFTITFTDESTGSPTSWEWSFPGGDPEMSTDQNVVVSYTTPGIYDVFLMASNEFGGSQIAGLAAVTVEDVPETPTFTMNTVDGISGEAFVDSPNPSYTYSWDFGNGDIANGPNAIYTYTETGNYTVMLTATNPCGETTATQEVNIIIDNVNTPAWASGLSLFPNPSNGVVQLEAEGWPSSGNIDLNLTNVLGQAISHQRINVLAGQWTYTLDWQHLPAGTYMLQLNRGNEVWSRKLIILSGN